MHKRLKPILVCPKCKGSLEYKPDTKQMVCPVDQLAYPVRSGVPVLLEIDAKNIESRDKT